MKKAIDFILRNKMQLLSFFAVLFCSVFAGAANVLIADVTVVPPPAGKTTTGSEGLSTQMPGEPTSATVMEANSDIYLPDIDKEISKFRSDFFPLDTIARQAAAVRKMGTYEVEHYYIDAARVSCATNAVYTETNTKKRFTLPIADTDASIFPQYSTIEVRGVKGWKEDGTTRSDRENLMLYVIGEDSASGIPVAIAINGPKVATGDVECYIPTIASGTKLYRLSNAASESQLFCPPSSTVPVGEKVYMQKKLINTSFTGYFESIKAKVPFDKQDIIENAIFEHRRDCERTYLRGVKRKITRKDTSMPHSKEENVYFSGGIMWQIRKSFEYTKGSFTYNDFIGITKLKFTGNNGSKTAFLGCGKDLLEEFHKINYTLYKDLQISSQTVWGIKMTSFESSFGTINVAHMPMLDELDMSDAGICLDLDMLVRYMMIDGKNREINMEVHGEDATRNVTEEIDCLCLKGFSHLLIKPTGVTAYSLPRTEVNVTSVNELPEAPQDGTVVHLTADSGEYKAGQLLQYNEETKAWVAYTGSVTI